MVRILGLFVFVSSLFLVQRSAVGQSVPYVNDDTPWVGWYWARHEDMKEALKILRNIDRLCAKSGDTDYLAKEFDPLKAEVIRDSGKAYGKFTDLKDFKNAFHGCYENPGPDWGAYVDKKCADERIAKWIEKFEKDRQEAKRRALGPLDGNGDPLTASSQTRNSAPVTQSGPRAH